MTHAKTITLAVVMAVAIPPIARSSENRSSVPIVVDAQRQLFIDDFVIDKSESIRRNLHRAIKYPGNPVLQPEKPWERHDDPGQGNAVLLFGSVQRQPGGGKLRMWYLTAERSAKRDPRLYDQGRVNWYCCLAESDDGIRWTRPNLGVVADLRGSKDNNIVVSTLTHSGLHVYVAPIRDPNPKDPQKRYRTIYHTNYRGHHDR